MIPHPCLYKFEQITALRAQKGRREELLLPVRFRGSERCRIKVLRDLHYEAAADEPLGPGAGSWAEEAFAAPSGVVPGPVASGCCCCADDEDEGPVTETFMKARLF